MLLLLLLLLLMMMIMMLTLDMQVIHSTPVIVAVLDFLNQLQILQKLPLERPPLAPGQHVPGQQVPGQQVPHQPSESWGSSTLADQVQLTFAVNNIPVHKPLVLPVLSMDFFCPGEPSKGSCSTS